MIILFDKINTNEQLLIEDKMKKEIIDKSENNIKNMIWRIECVKNGIPYTSPWQEIVNEIIDLIIKDKQHSLKKMCKIRELLGLLFISNIDANLILEYMLKWFVKSISDKKLLSSIIQEIAIYDKQLKNSTRYILHFEAFFNSIILILDT
jgi:hypothetical protein